MGASEALYGISQRLQRTAKAVPPAIKGAVGAGKDTVVANATVLKEMAPVAGAQLIGVLPMTSEARKLKEKELSVEKFQKMGLAPNQYQENRSTKRTRYDDATFRESYDKLPTEVKEKNRKIAGIQAGIDKVASIVFPNWAIERFIDRGNKVDQALGVENDPIDQHLAGRPLTRGVKILADIAARATPAVAVLTGAIGPVEGLLVSELATAANTLASDFAYGWRRRIADQKKYGSK